MLNIITMVTTKKTAIENIQKEMRKEFKHLTIKTQLNTKKKPTTKNTLPSKALIQIQWRNKKLYRQARAKRI